MKKRSAKPGITAKILTIIFGLLLCLLLLELGLRVAGSVFLSLQERRNRIAIQQKEPYRVMCLGESTTAIGGVYSYPSQLQEILNKRGIGVKFSVINGGVPRINTSDILDRLEYNLDMYRPDMVITMMGNNDRGSNMFYQAGSGLKAANFFGSFSVYKLTRILWMHLLAKLKEPVFDKPNRNTSKVSWETIHKNYRAYVEVGRSYLNQGKFPEAEELFRKALEIEPRNDGAYLELGWVFRIQGKFPEAEAAFKKAIEINPKNYWPYVEQGGFSEAEDLFKKAIERDPLNDWLYIGLGWIYQDQGKFAEAEAAFRKAKEVNPQNNWLAIRIGPYYRAQDSLVVAESAFKKAVKANPMNDRPYVDIGQAYLSQGRLTQAKEALMKAVELNPRNDGAYVGLGSIFRAQSRFLEAEAAFKKAIELNPKNDIAYRTLKVLYIEMGDPRLGLEYERKSDELKADFYPQVTADNYHKLKAILDKRGIVYVCMQYPIRSIEPLKKIFQGNPDDIVFVDNNKLFKDAVQKDGYKEYFIDLCNGDSGHCTPKGNRLLAENVANVILDKVFPVIIINAAQNRERH
jgi:tetratricopeptide (TPR) repeat protein